MTSPFDHASRRERLRHRLGALGVGLFLVTRPVNVRYLTGFSGDSTALLCLPGQDLLVSDGRYSEQLARECPDLEVFIRPPSVTLPMALGEVLRSTGEIAGMGLMGLGGLIAVIGGLLFIVVVVKAMRAAPGGRAANP